MNAGRITMTDRKAGRLFSLAIFLALCGVLTFFTSCASPAPAKHPTEVAEIPGATFTVRISAFPEEHGGFVSGAYYRFESLPSGGKSWVPAMEFRHDDPVPIPRQNVRFLSPRCAFVFMGWKYAVTTDGGNHWQVWNAEKDLVGWRYANYELIQGVELEPNGAGKMFLRPIPGRRGEVPELVTADFGWHWTAPSPHD
jgi:hypothetical protein